jgi:hypothetical protein
MRSEDFILGLVGQNRALGSTPECQKYEDGSGIFYIGCSQESVQEND